MQTLSKSQVSNWILLDYAAQKQVLQANTTFLERKYALDFLSFENKIKEENNENFEEWDDYIEWKAYNQFLNEITFKMEEIKNGNFQLAE